jgi:hypothetical protein
VRETLLHWTAALSFALTAAYLHSRLIGPREADQTAPNTTRSLAS